jgi:hypothetical protein
MTPTPSECISLSKIRSREQASFMSTPLLMLKRANASRLSGEWSDDDYDVLDGRRGS